MTPLWHIQLLGGFRLRCGDEEITRFRTRKMAGLLAYLACYSDRTHSRERLQELFWPEADLDAARNSLNVALNALRKPLEPVGTASGSVLIADRTHVQLNPRAIVVDVHTFAADVQRGLTAPEGPDSVAALTTAVATYAGPFLPDQYDNWVVSERERLSDLCLSALRRLIKELARSGDCERALGYARQAVALDPLREEFHRSVMRLCVATGGPATALEQYRELERQLQSALNAVPSAATRQLAAQIASAMSAGAVEAERTPSEASAHSSQSELASSPTPQSEASPAVRDRFGPGENNLPVQFSRFFGREGELGQIREILFSDSTRLVTLTGLGGCGKTRLALEAARLLLPYFTGGVWWVSVSDLDRADRLAEAIRDALELPRRAGDPVAQFAEALAGRSALLVLDNAEHLAEKLGVPVQQLLRAASGLKFLVTSRQALEIGDEREIALTPLPTPKLKHEGGRMKDENNDVSSSFILHPSSLLSIPSVQLFVDRAQARRADFQITRKNVEALATLCARLEGLPLAIELAASWSRLLTPEQMLVQLDQRFDFLVSRRSDLPPRHRTLRAAIESSYQFLWAEQQALFTALAVFRGGFTLEAVEAVCGDPAETPTRGSVLELLAQLQAHSLIVADAAEEEAEQAMRYRMLESLREFAEEQWSPERRSQLGRRHALYFADLASEAVPHLHGPTQSDWLQRLEVEHSNLQAALKWCATDPDSGEVGLRLGAALWRFWHVHAHYRLGYDLLVAMLAHPAAQEPTLLRIRGLHGAGVLAWSLADYERSRTLHTESLTLARQLGYTHGVAASLGNLAIIASMELDFDTARRLQGESLAIYRELGERAGMAPALNGLGQAALSQNDLEAAEGYLAEALIIYRELGNHSGLSIALGNQSRLAVLQGRFQEARSMLQEKLRIDRNLGFTAGTVSMLLHSAALAAAEGQIGRAVRLWAATAALRSRLGITLPRRDQVQVDHDIDLARATLGPEAFASAWEQGEAMPLDDACLLALQTPELSPSPR
jgi:predicted ATPase/DNA-binding SARP family transcriptional activator